MRLRKVKYASEKIDASKYVIKNYKDFTGHFKDLFNNNNPIYIEIGMGKGNFIINNALRNPNINYIGIEKFDSVMVRAIEKIENINIPNLKFIKMDAIDIDNVFKNEISKIYLNFSDPWPKKRHANRRLTSLIFLKKYDKIFNGEKNITMKTDNRKLFEYSLMSFTNYDYKINEISLNLYEDDISLNIQTEYEEKFVSKGLIIYFVDVVKK